MRNFKDGKDTRAAYKMQNMKGIFSHFDGIHQVMSGGYRVMSDFMNPQVGDGVTEIWYSDSKAHTVVKRNKWSITIKRDNAKLMNSPDSGEEDALVFNKGGFVGHTHGTQRYEYSENPEGRETVYTRRKNGRWVAKGQSMMNGTRVLKGRNEHYDFNF